MFNKNQKESILAKMSCLMMVVVLSMIFCAGCRPDPAKDDTSDEESSGTTTDVLVEAHIDSMGVQPWDKTRYIEVLTKEIPDLDADKQSSMTTKLKYVYSTVLVREGTGIMDDGCKAGHSRLQAVITELGSDDAFDKAEGADQLKSRYASHQDVLALAKKLDSTPQPRSFTDSYTPALTAQEKSRAAAYISGDPNCCSEIKNKLSASSIASKEQARKHRFCEALVRLYTSRSVEWNRGDENRLIDNLSRYGNWREWESAILRYRETHKKDGL